MDISNLSPIAALLAVLIAWKSLTIANRQMGAALKTADKQITAPMRQAWINKLRELLAEFTSSSMRYHAAGFEGRRNGKNMRLLFLLDHIRLMLNPEEAKHQRLEKLMNRMMIEIQDEKEQKTEEFPKLWADVMNLSREILKKEWGRVKEPIQTGEAAKIKKSWWHR